LGACTTNNKGGCTDTTTAVLWDFAAGRQLRTWGNGTGVAAISPNGLWIGEEMYNDSPDASTIVLWNLATGESVRRFEIDGVYPKLYFSPDSRWIVINTKRAQVFEVSTGKRGPALDLEKGDAPSSVAFTPDSRFVAGADGDIVVWNLSTGREVTRLKVPGNDARTVAISPDGRWIAGSSSGQLTLFRRTE
jgi:WD40 repeat protein